MNPVQDFLLQTEFFGLNKFIQFFIRILCITLVSRNLCICKIMEQVWTISVPDLIARYGKIAFQFSSNSILFSSHIGSFAKNFFFYI